jgi:hypothetical protein
VLVKNLVTPHNIKRSKNIKNKKVSVSSFLNKNSLKFQTEELNLKVL